MLVERWTTNGKHVFGPSVRESRIVQNNMLLCAKGSKGFEFSRYHEDTSFKGNS
jgi:hypothetical protein